MQNSFAAVLLKQFGYVGLSLLELICWAASAVLLLHIPRACAVCLQPSFAIFYHVHVHMQGGNA